MNPPRLNHVADSQSVHAQINYIDIARYIKNLGGAFHPANLKVWQLPQESQYGARHDNVRQHW